MGGIRRRLDVWGISVGTQERARSDPWDPALDAYETGVRRMMTIDDARQWDVNSWLWAANTHGIPANTRPKALWDQCAHGNRFFLPWHRAYLRWFEATIQSLIDDPDWALPYWNYSDPDRELARSLPPEFRVAERTVNGVLVKNHLFVDSADRPGEPSEAGVEIIEAMAEPFFVRSWPQRGFGGVDGLELVSSKIESLPHNRIHTDIGGTPEHPGLMRQTTTAARDPIFWLHHANIDRLWEVWRRLPGSIDLLDRGSVSTQTASEWQSARFAFGGRRRVDVYSMNDISDTTSASMNYEYEVTRLSDADEAAVAARRLAQSPGMVRAQRSPQDEQWQPVAATEHEILVGEGGAEAQVTIDEGQRQLVAGGPQSLPSGLIIALMGVRAAVGCHDNYVVDVAAGPGKPTHEAGSFNTFGLNGTPASEQRSYSIDATRIIPLLREDEWDGSGLVIAVRPESPVVGAARTPDGIEIEQVVVYQLA